MGICCMSQETQTGALYPPSGVGRRRGGGEEVGREMGGSFKREGIYVYLWPIHVEV